MILEPLAQVLRHLLELAALLTISLGLISLLPTLVRGRSPLLDRLVALRLQFGSWLALALEFQLGADIVATTLNPGTSQLVQLGAIAVIRTLLNWFLQRELEAEQRHLQRKDEPL
jgi:uncharacterized membrane protein